MRLTVICDFIEESWFSMDLVADMLCQELQRRPDVELLKLRPRRFPPSQTRRVGLSRMDRFSRTFGRFVQYPVVALTRRSTSDFFHIADHSYAHLALFLPKGRIGIFCHDCDAFRAARDSKAAPYRVALARVLLKGLRRAEVVFYSTEAVRRELKDYVRLPDDRLIAAPYGIAPEFTCAPNEFDASVSSGAPYVLHVGTCIPRKNPGFLIELFGALVAHHPTLHFIQVGGEWTADHTARIAELGLTQRVRQIRGIPRAELAALYRNACAVVMPSTAEGFGLPLTEALASGAVVVASDLPVLREVGGAAVIYLPVSDLPAWVAGVSEVLEQGPGVPEAGVRFAQAGGYTWARQAETILDGYRVLR
jgi:glycosyltransferase involved in cell wall biosynthesis